MKTADWEYLERTVAICRVSAVILGSAGLETKHHCAGEDPQQFNRQTQSVVTVVKSNKYSLHLITNPNPV
jgi:hypothetical protein